MAILSSLTQIQKELKTFQGSLLDNSGKVKLENLPSNYIQNTFEVATKAGLTSLLTADRNDIAFVADEDTNYRLKTNDPTNLANWIEQPFIVQQGTPPIGATYIRVLSDSFARFPSETLYDFDNNLLDVSFLTTQPIKYLYPGTIWKLAVREGDFIRQIKIDPVLETTNFMGEQEDQLQGFEVKLLRKMGTAGGDSNMPRGNGYTGEFLDSFPNCIKGVVMSDGINGEPRLGSETRPINTSVEMWVRIA